MSRPQYPPTRRDEEVSDEYPGGVRVADPYRWLEDPDSAETSAWVAAQNSVTRAVLDACPSREKMRQRVTDLYNYERCSVPYVRGKRLFFRLNTGLQNQAVLYKQGLEQGAAAEVFLDPNALSEDGTAALGATAFSDDGSLMAYCVARSGSDWQTVGVREVATCRDLPDRLEWVKFSGMSWTHDGAGFFYARYPAPESSADPGAETSANLGQALYYHRLGAPQSEDQLVFRPENPKWMVSGEVTDDGATLLLAISESTDNVNRLFYARLGPGGSVGAAPLEVVRLVDNFEAEYSYVLNDGDRFVFKTNLAAPRGKLVELDLATGQRRDLVPEHPGRDVLSDAVAAGDAHVALCYLTDVREEVRLLSLADGRLAEGCLPVPAAGALEGVSGRRRQPHIYYKFASFLYPGTIYRHDLRSGETVVFRETRVPGFDPAQFETRQVFYASADGTRVPMYLCFRRGLALDGSNPALLYGYGGFNISLLPSFHVPRLVYAAHMGAVVAVANLRGGGEYGEEWHKAGTKHQKQNVFDDFHAAAEYLVREGYTRPERLSIHGGSNGGLLVAACSNQRPELYACAVAACGVMDMLRFHRFTIGYAWCSDYGRSDDAEDFAALRRYSPLHNVDGSRAPYPAVLLTTADHDDRVVPLHSYKLAAELQHRLGDRPQQARPLLVRIECKAGHGAGKPLAKIIDEVVDTYCFMAAQTGAVWRD